FLAIRPFQVDPPWQSLNMVGGVAPIHSIRYDASAAWVNRDKPVILTKAPEQFGATSIESGSIRDFMREGQVPPQTAASDRFGLASAATASRLPPPTQRKKCVIASKRRSDVGSVGSPTSASSYQPRAKGSRGC